MVLFSSSFFETNAGIDKSFSGKDRNLLTPLETGAG